MLRRCYSTRRGNAARARIAAALLQQALRQHCGAVAARSNDEKQRTMQRWLAALVLAATAGRATLLYSDGRWLTLKIFFFYSTISKREREQDRERRDRASKHVS
jgi:hypothetical protein